MDRRSFTICEIDDYEQALQLIGYMSDENANDCSEIDCVVDAVDVLEFIELLLAVVHETQNETR